jgi:hypothetical protein
MEFEPTDHIFAIRIRRGTWTAGASVGKSWEWTLVATR